MIRTFILIVPLLVSCTVNLLANGIAGGEIQYQYIVGSGSGNTRDYEVTLVLYQIQSNYSPNQTRQVVVSSSCFANDTLTLRYFEPSWLPSHPGGGVRFSPEIHCESDSVVDSLEIFAFYFKDTVSLPGKCSDYLFEFESCCRDSSISNISNAASTAFYLQATLNNSLNGENHSGEIILWPRYKHYVGYPATWFPIAVAEPDGDSLNYTLVNVRDSSGASISYNAPYSGNYPYNTGKFPFSIMDPPTLSGQFTLAWETSEYRFDTIFFLWYKVGSMMREMTYYISDTVPSNVVSSLFGGPGTTDTLRNISCNNSIISLPINGFMANSVSSDGSEFRVVDRYGVLNPVIGVGLYNLNPALRFDSVWLQMLNPVAPLDTLQISLRKGTDGNTLINDCGYEYSNFDNGILLTGNCQVTTSLNSIDYKRFSTYPNPAKDKITVEFDENEIPEQIRIFDLQGHKLLSVQPESSITEIDVSDLSKGIYLLKVQSGDLIQSRIIQKL